MDDTFRLNDGRALPRLGLGVYEMKARETRAACEHAFRAGYRHVDTASMYGNEKEVGEAVRACGIPRAQLWITTKLWNSDHPYERALRAGVDSRARLGLDRIDLYLIHWPATRTRADAWRALVKLQADGVVGSIGVSNYTERHLQELFDATGAWPAVNQVELSPFLAQRALVAFCHERKIAVEAYSPLTRGEKLGHPALGEIARRHGRSAAQVVLRWALQRDLIVLPKSAHAARIEENAGALAFTLPAEDMVKLDALDEGFRTCWDPTDLP